MYSDVNPTPSRVKKIAYLASNSSKAQKAASILQERYGIYQFNPNYPSDIILVAGGDGFMLRSIHTYLHYNIPFYGINCGEVGFLLNPYNLENLLEKLDFTFSFNFTPLEIGIKHLDGAYSTVYCVNDLTVLRQNAHTASIKVNIGHHLVIDKLVGDGIIISSSIGSSAYNYSAGGPIIFPNPNDLLILTPINSYRPKKMGSIVVDRYTPIRLTVLENLCRPVLAIADYITFSNVDYVETLNYFQPTITLLFNSPNSIINKINKQYFT